MDGTKMTRALLATGFACFISAVQAGKLIQGQSVLAPDGLTRYYDLYVPDNLPAAAPVVLYYHGGSLDDDSVFWSTSPSSVWTSVADANGILLIAPNGTNVYTGSTDSSSGYFNDCDTSAASSGIKSDDVGAARAIVAAVGKAYPIDPSRVYATGVSNGGMMALRLGREAGDLVAAVGVSAGLDPQAANDQCHDDGLPRSVLIEQGNADSYVLYNGGCGIGGGCRLSFDQTVSAWLARNDLSGAVAVGDPIPESGIPDWGASVDCQIYGGAAPAQEVSACTVDNGGHSEASIAVSIGLFGALILGNQDRDLETAQASWTFFSRH